MINSKTNLKKIFIVGPTESLLTRRGNRHPALAKYLVEQGFTLEYVTSNFYHAEKRWFSSEEITIAKLGAPYKLTVKQCIGYKANISLQRILSNILLSINFFFYLLPRLNKNSILILPSRPVEMIFAAAMLRLFRNATVALDIQDIWPDMLVVRSKVKKLFFTLYCNIFLYSSLRFINKFFHVAPSFLVWLNRYAPNAKSTFIPLGFDPDRWLNSNRQKNYSNNTQIELVCVSQLTFQFDILPLVNAIKGNDRFRLTIIGEDGTGERYSEVNEFVDTNKMENIVFLGKINREEMASHLAKMDIGVVPMISTSIPNKTFDYIASYLPILSLGNNDVSNFVTENNIGWTSSFDHVDIKETLQEISLQSIQLKQKSVAKIRPYLSRECLHLKIVNTIFS